jgi:hypothetical protein
MRHSTGHWTELKQVNKTVNVHKVNYAVGLAADACKELMLSVNNCHTTVAKQTSHSIDRNSAEKG